MEKVKSLRKRLAPFLRWPIFGFWMRDQNVVSPIVENFLRPRKCSVTFEKSLRDRHPICGKMDT